MSKTLKENLYRTLKGDSFNIEQEVIDQNNQITFGKLVLTYSR